MPHMGQPAFGAYKDIFQRRRQGRQKKQKRRQMVIASQDHQSQSLRRRFTRDFLLIRQGARSAFVSMFNNDDHVHLANPKNNNNRSF